MYLSTEKVAEKVLVRVSVLHLSMSQKRNVVRFEAAEEGSGG